MSVLKIKTYKYRQNDRLDKMDPLHSIAPVWVQKLRSYSWKTKILKIAAVFKNGAIDGENMTFLAYLAFLCFWRRWLMFIVKKLKSLQFGSKGVTPLTCTFSTKLAVLQSGNKIVKIAVIDPPIDAFDEGTSYFGITRIF